MSLSFRDAIVVVLQDFATGLHYKDIDSQIKERNLVETLGNTSWLTINSLINQDIKFFAEKSTFKRVEGKKGWFGLNTAVISTDIPTIEDKPTEKTAYIPEDEKALINEVKENMISTQYKGKGGELAVSSELLFRGYNTSIPNVDDGIDLIAVKDEKFFYFQVKTLTERQNNYPFRVKRTSFHRRDQNVVFYIFVMRGKATNQYIIIHNNILKFLIQSGHVTKSDETYNINIRENNNKRYLGDLSIDHLLSNREDIK